MRPTRLLWLLLVPVLLLAACSDDDDDGGGPATTTTTAAATATTEAGSAPVVQADVPLITKLWADKSAAYEQGLDAAARFIFEHNYPDLRETETLENCRQALTTTTPDGYREDNVVSTDTIRRDDGWNPQIGNVQSPPRGRTYAMVLTITQSIPGQPPQQTTGGAHVTIRDGKAYFFLPCPKPAG